MSIKDLDFKIRAICMDKFLIYSNELKNNKESFYNYTIKQLLIHSHNLKNAYIKIDGHADKAYKRSATTYLRKEVNKKNKK
jgi:hypothetical protein